MDVMTMMVIAGCILSAGVVYVVLKVDHSARAQTLQDEILALQTEAADQKKRLQDCTRYSDYVAQLPTLLADKFKAPAVKLSREMTHAECIVKEKYKLRADVVIVSKYQVDFAFMLDANALSVAAHTNGLALKVSRPTLAAGEPALKLLSQQVISANAVSDDRALLAEADANFRTSVRTLARNLVASEQVLALCRLRVAEAARDALAVQPGVRQVPALFVDFK